MPQASLFDNAGFRAAERRAQVATLAKAYEPPAWPFRPEHVVEQLARSTPDEVSAAGLVHFQLARAAFDRAESAERRKAFVGWSVGAVLLLALFGSVSALAQFDLVGVGLATGR